MKRSSGVLLSITSLPGPYGIGTLGRSAYEFTDFLVKAGQRFWQILPLGPTSYGDSPYQSFSTFAGNPYLIDPDMLIEDGLLKPEEVKDREWGSEPRYVDYGKIYENRFDMLRLAAERGLPRDREAVDAFVRENEKWLPDYALFMACKKHNGMRAWTEWPEDIRNRSGEALARCREEYREDIDFFTYVQYLFFKQWNKLRDYIHGKGIKIIGDVPIYVAMDSADIWAEPQFFQLDSDGVPKEIAGVPPDPFTADGQLWGNPLYDWKHHRDTGYAWWISRMRRCSSLFDIVRIDHFRGFDQYYAIPADSADARIGQWEEGPGIGLFRAIEKEIPGLTIIAEDLGYITESVRQLVRDTGYPNMKVLEFAFDSRDSSGRESYLPYNFDKNCVVYTGTHDNETLVGWLDHILPEEREEVRAFTGLDGAGGDPWAYDACEDAAGETGFCDAAARGTDLCAADACRDTACEDAVNDAGRDLETRRLARAMVRAAMASVGNLCVIPMQDWLLLGDEARINTPSTTGKNWVWRMDRGAASPELAAQIRRMTRTYGR